MPGVKVKQTDFRKWFWKIGVNPRERCYSTNSQSLDLFWRSANSFSVVRRNRKTTPHNRELDDRLNRIERTPLVDPVAADHNDRYPQPDAVNGHRPDIVTEDVFGNRTRIEVEHRDDNSKRTREQHAAFEQAPGGFEVEYVDDRDDNSTPASGVLDGVSESGIYDPTLEFENKNDRDADRGLFGFL